MTSFRLAALGACALLPLIAQAAAQINAPPSRTVKPATEREPIYLQAEEVVYDDERKIVSVAISCKDMSMVWQKLLVSRLIKSGRAWI